MGNHVGKKTILLNSLLSYYQTTTNPQQKILLKLQHILLLLQKKFLSVLIEEKMARFSVVVFLLAGSLVLGQEVSSSAEVNINNGGAVAIASGSASSKPTVSNCPCNDEPPKAGKNEKQYTCAEQKAFGKCDADFMLGFCECTCERCCPCNDFPPTGEQFTCLQQKDFGKCGAGFMKGFCECECGRCAALTGEDPVTEKTVPPAETPKTPEKAPEKTPVEVTEPVAVSKGCSDGLIPIFGSSDCETARCAQNRQKCANGCGGLSEIKFDCKDVADGKSSAFSSSCACAGSK
eukprot:TRINITY_DN1170_c0_g1_i1.p2 TRINITY_DN1170_c0_g1~~TRINITY_DN1170_c0_g1_i1.p2  ORF type:complete len:291 (+),score=64.28 TRINITY_DN1170_c0_g1_i1:46-918(+)